MITICVFSFLGSAATANSQESMLPDLQAYDSLEEDNTSVSKEPLPGSLDSTKIRLKSMKSAAISLGAQHGYIHRLNALKNEITQNSDALDMIFDFNTLMKLASHGNSELYLLPAIIRESNNVIALSDNSKHLRISGKIWEIVQEERLVGLAPNWRTYLILDSNIQMPSPHKALLPKSQEEKNAWAEWVAQGWIAGIDQAEYEMTHRVRRLGADYNGMSRYMRLVLEGKAERPIISQYTQHVAGGGSQMREQDTVYQISRAATLNSDYKEWNTLILDPRKGFRHKIELEE